jgi:hypothetical protein
MWNATRLRDLPEDTIGPVAGLTQLVRLRSDGSRGWSALRACAALEDVAASRPRLANLRSLKRSPGIGLPDRQRRTTSPARREANLAAITKYIGRLID